MTVTEVKRAVAENIGVSVSFDASDSFDNIGIVSYEWDFGDGTKGTGKQSLTYTRVQEPTR